MKLWLMQMLLLGDCLNFDFKEPLLSKQYCWSFPIPKLPFSHHWKIHIFAQNQHSYLGFEIPATVRDRNTMTANLLENTQIQFWIKYPYNHSYILESRFTAQGRFKKTGGGTESCSWKSWTATHQLVKNPLRTHCQYTSSGSDQEHHSGKPTMLRSPFTPQASPDEMLCLLWDLLHLSTLNGRAVLEEERLLHICIFFQINTYCMHQSSRKHKVRLDYDNICLHSHTCHLPFSQEAQGWHVNKMPY